MVEARLWQERRAFIKTLRYDGEEDVFPDFVLTDVAGTEALPMEVFGINTPDYLQRKQVNRHILSVLRELSSNKVAELLQ